MIKSVIIFLVLVLAVSCSPSAGSDTVVQSFELQPERILEEELGLALYVVGPYILAMQHQKVPDGEIYHVYDLKTREFLGGVGLRGTQAPNAFYGTAYGGQYYQENGDWIMWVNDPPRHRLSALNITKSLREGQPIFERTIKHKSELDFMHVLFVQDDETLIGHQPGYYDGTNTAPINILKDGILTSHGEYPVFDEFPEGKKWEQYTDALNSVRLGLNPESSNLVSAMAEYDLLTIYSVAGDFMHEYRPEATFQTYKATITNEQTISFGEVRWYYMSVATTKTHIYALYLNDLRPEDKRTKQPIIRVFNWKAELLYELKVPVSIWSISVDEENGFIYSGSYDEEALYRFDIKGFKK